MVHVCRTNARRLLTPRAVRLADWLFLGGIGGLLLLAPAVAFAQAEQKKLPDFATLEAVVRRHFQTQNDYRPGDLITRSQVAEALDVVRIAGWKVPGGEALARQTIEDHAFLARQLRTEPGRKFMDHVKKDPGGYDRLDRLSTMPQGRQNIAALVRGPGGWQLIDYMTKTQGGENLGKQLSRTPTGHDFNKPTGRIYTEDQLLDELRSRYEQEAARLAEQE